MLIKVIEPLNVKEELINKYQKEIENLNHKIIFYNDRKDDEKSLINRIKDADVIILTNLKISKEVLMSNKNLKYVITLFAGVDHLPIDYLKENNIKLTNALGYSKNAVSELTVASLISFLRNVNDYSNNISNGYKSTSLPLGEEISGKSIGVIGTGDIGLNVLRLFKAFNLKLYAYSRTKKEEALEMGVEYLELDELLKTVDFVSLHVPLTNDTYHLLNKDNLKLLKENAVVVNFARGNVIDYSALYEILKNKKIKGAIIDVFEVEPPLVNHPFFNLDNVLLLPHIGYYTKEAYENRFVIGFDALIKYLKEVN